MWGILARVLMAVLVPVFNWLIGKILILFGISMVTYIGVKPLYDAVIFKVKAYMAMKSPEGIPIIEWLGVLRLDICVSILISALGIKIVLNGLDSVTKFKFSPGSK